MMRIQSRRLIDFDEMHGQPNDEHRSNHGAEWDVKTLEGDRCDSRNGAK